ncbi:MAG TPA: hypothetical protein VFZ73_01735 [Gemmatimonadaceae bacterium]
MLTPSTKTVPVLAVLLAACAGGSEPTASILETSAVTNNGVGVELQVNGAGLVDLPNPFGDMKFQFVAHRRADGTVMGHFRFTRQNPDGLIDFEGDVTCVTSDPSFPGRARIGGIVTENNSASPGSLTANHEVGDDVWFRVQDNGNGGAVTDRVTVLGFAPVLVNTSEEYCALPFADGPFWSASIFPVVDGTIRVNP